eukprot:jgi/Picre1/27843/NNA_000807.t1
MQHRNRPFSLKVALGDLVFENIKSLLQEAHLSCQGWLENFSCHGAVRASAGFVAKKSHDSTKTNKSSANKARMKGKKKKAISENESNRNEYDKALGRMKGQMSRFRQEQALIMAYDADGGTVPAGKKLNPH